MHSSPYSRRRFLSIATRTLGLTAIGTITGCGNSPVAKTIAAISGQRSGGDVFSRDYIEKNPYDYLAAGIGDLPRILLVRSRLEANQWHWQSADSGTFITEQGRLLKTVGLNAGDLAGEAPLTPDPLRAKTFSKAGAWVQRVDLFPGRKIGLVIKFTWIPVRVEQTSTFWGEGSLLRVDETGYCKAENWHFINQFWIDESTGEALKSIQHIYPNAPALSLERLHPYRPKT